MDAQTTNVLTNLFHAGFLILYFWLSIKYDLRKSVKVFFFFLLSAKIFGSAVHYVKDTTLKEILWLCVAANVLCINYYIYKVVRSKHPFWVLGLPTVSILIFCLPIFSHILGSPVFLKFAMLFPFSPRNFIYVALAVLWVGIAGALSTKSLVRIGFSLTAGSNILWIVLRKTLSALHGDILPEGLRYDNDLYHIALIVSTYILFKGLCSQKRNQTL